MPSIINSDSGAVSGSAGLKFTSADDGVLQIQNNGNTAISISSAGIATFANPTIQTIPLFSAAFASQNVTGGVQTLFSNETVEMDNYGWWTANDHRWTAQIPGWYEMHVYILGSGSVSLIVSRIYKNGSNYAGGTNRPSTSVNSIGSWISRFIYLNGTTDYLQAYGQVYGTSLSMSGHAQIKLIQRDPL
jgi:hypothetical protein